MRAEIERSLELAGERSPDITPLVYEKLFARFPEMEALFIRDRNGAVRGEMLARLIEAILDFLDGDTYATNFLRCEIVTHEGYGVPPDVFPKFIEALVTTVRDLSASDWTPVTEDSWNTLLARLTPTQSPAS
ncbi:MAG TPA: globin [Rhizomicrobium sp.]|jgi:hemoglobin-like flavoprotein